MADSQSTVIRKAIPGFDGHEADSAGNIWGLLQNWHGRGDRPLVQEEDTHGYLSVRLYRNGRRVRKPVHQLLALAFCGPRPPNSLARHLDDNRKNNAIENLAWGTSKDNGEDRVRNGRTASGLRNGHYTCPDRFPKGSKMPAAKLTEDDVVEILRRLQVGESKSSIARDKHINRGVIRGIANGTGWRHVPRP